MIDRATRGGAPVRTRQRGGSQPWPGRDKQGGFHFQPAIAHSGQTRTGFLYHVPVFSPEKMCPPGPSEWLEPWVWVCSRNTVLWPANELNFKQENSRHLPILTIPTPPPTRKLCTNSPNSPPPPIYNLILILFEGWWISPSLACVLRDNGLYAFKISHR